MKQIWPAKSEVTWLIKSGDRILGPYSADTIEKLLISREIVVIDEVKRALGRWKYIREEAFFAVAVEKLRAIQQSKAEDTEHGSLSGPTATLTISTTDDLSVTSDIEVPSLEISQSSFVKEADFIDLDAAKIKMPPPIPAARQFGLTDNSNVQQDIKRSSSAAWFLAILFVCIALTIAYRNQLKTPQSGQGPDFSKSYDLAIKNYKLGYFAESLKYFKEAANLKPNDPDVIIAMAPLLINIDGQKVEVKRKIGEVLAMVHSDGQVKQARNILGLLAIADEDLVEASHQFGDALKIDSKFLPALFNNGIVRFLQKDFIGAIKDFRSVLIEDPENAAAAYLIIRIEVMVAVLERKTSFPSLHESINHFNKRFYDLRQEATLLNAYLFSREEIKNQLVDEIRSCIETDPFTSDEFLRDPLIFSGQLAWNHLAPYCDEMARKFSNLPEMKALNTICLLKTGRVQEGPKLIEEAIAQAPSDSLILDVNAFLLMTSGREEEARGALQIAKKNNTDILSKILMGRLCLKNNEEKCALDNFKSIKSQSLNPAFTVFALAKVAQLEGSFDPIKFNRDRFSRRNLKNYLPLLRLESAIEAK